MPKWIAADRGYTGYAFRQHVWDIGARPAIPPLRHEAPVASFLGVLCLAAALDWIRR